VRRMVKRFAAWLEKYHRKHLTPDLVASLNILERLGRVRR
jgi:hypothetical protein